MFRRLRHLAYTALLLPALAAPVAAQPATDPAALATATELFALLAPGLIDEMIDTTITQTWPQIDATLPAIVDQATRQELQDELVRQLRLMMDAVMLEAPGIYADLFTVAELRDLVVFYRSPLGVKLLATTPAVMARTLQLTTEQLAIREPDITRAFESILRRHGF